MTYDLSDVNGDENPRQGSPGNPYITTITLIAINVLVFFAMVAKGVSLMKPTPQQVLPWGADFGPLTIGEGQWWRMLTACFVHFGIIHIAMNMYVLFQIGPFIEIVFGRARYLLLYFFAGLFGSVVSLWVHPMTTGAGASGAIFGLYGAVFSFLLTERHSLDPAAMKSIGRSSGIFLIYNLIYGATSGTTDLSAHLGGIVAGFIAGILLVRRKTSGPWRMPVTAASVVLMAMLAGGIAALAARPVNRNPGNEFIATLVTGSSVPLVNGGKLIYTGEVTAPDATKVAAALNARLRNARNVLVVYSRKNGKTTLSIPLGSRKEDTHSVLQTTPAQPSADSRSQPWNSPEVMDAFTALGQQILPVVGGTSMNLILLNGDGVPERTIIISAK